MDMTFNKKLENNKIKLSFYTVMLNLFQHLTSLEYRFHIGEILNQVQDDNKIGISNAGREVRYKSLHDKLVVFNAGREVRYKSLHDKLVVFNAGREVRYKKCLA